MWRLLSPLTPTVAREFALSAATRRSGRCPWRSEGSILGVPFNSLIESFAELVPVALEGESHRSVPGAHGVREIEHRRDPAQIGRGREFRWASPRRHGSRRRIPVDCHGSADVAADNPSRDEPPAVSRADVEVHPATRTLELSCTAIEPTTVPTPAEI